MRKLHKKLIRQIAFCLITLLLLVVAPQSAVAAPAIDVNHRVGLTIDYKILGIEIEKAEFSLYQVAALGADGTYTLTADFENADVKVNGLNSDETQNAANAFYGYIVKNNVSPTLTRKTNAVGKAIFMGSNLYPGMYVLTCKPHQAYGEMCHIQPMLLNLPTLIHDKWIYNIEITPKYSVIPKETEVHALVIWRDPDESMRPETVELQLINEDARTGRSIPEFVNVGKADQWRYSWEVLPLANWLVVQTSVPEGYTLTTQREGNLFIFINTRNDYNPNPPGGGGGSGWKPWPDSPPTATQAPTGTLPQTGTLWWPVPILAAGGVLCIVIGLLFRRKED